MLPSPWVRRVTLLTACLAALLCVVSRGAQAAGDGRLHLYWIDSEGGGSTLVVTPSGESVLLDAGNPGGRDAERIHRVATGPAGLSRIDHLIVTHFHIDHFGGAPELAALMPIRNLWDNGLPDADPDGNRESTWPLTSRGYREMKVEARHRVAPGQLVPLQAAAVPLFLRCVIARQALWKPEAKGPATWPVRKPAGPAVAARNKDTSDNANSSAWVLGFGSFRFYDGGDLTWNVEASLVTPEVVVPEVDIYQITHHGLDNSNHPGLMRALNPRVTVMNNGAVKGCMPEVVRNLRAMPGLEAVYQVHRNLRADGATNNAPEAFIANGGRSNECAGHYIHARVEPDGSAYTLRIPAHGHEARYQVKAGRP